MSTSRITVEDLLRHRTWLRSIARHLVRDDAEDVVQDVWTQAAERPPTRATNPRGWLSTVLLNRVRSLGRSDARRHRRNLVSTDWSDAPATPEEATAQLELQRKLATLIAELPDPFRHVLYLRYVEDRDPAEIAQLLSLPGGTVRWRLKEALSKLRSRLDEEHGGKRAAWVAMLPPLVVDRADAPASGRWRLPALLAMPVAVLVVASVWPWQGAPRSETLSSGTANRTPDGAGGGERRPLAALFVAAEADRCTGLEPLRRRLAELRKAADPWWDLRELFAENAPNPQLTSRLEALLAPAFLPVPQICERSITCRGDVCEIVLLAPEGTRPDDCAPRTGLAFWDHLASGANNMTQGSHPFRDPLSRRSFSRQTILLRMLRQDGTAVPRAERPPLPPLGYDLSAPLPRPSEPLSAACEAIWRELAAEHRRIGRDLADRVPPQVFAASAVDAQLGMRVTRWAAKILGRPADDLPFTTECRATVCRLTPGADSDALALRWTCSAGPPGQEGRCSPAKEDHWLSRLEKHAPRIGRLRPPLKSAIHGQVKPAFLVVSRTDGRASPWTAALAFTGSFDWRSEIKKCEAQHPGQGTLKMRMEIPEVALDDLSPKHVGCEFGGELAGTDLGRCVQQLFEAAAGSFRVPPNDRGLTTYALLRFPFDARSFEAQLASLRRTSEDESEVPF